MDLNVGEFVRTKNGYIGKIENINDFRPPESKYAIDIQMGDLVFIGEDLIAKNSEDIIDLIEVGDYVNGKRVLEKIGNMFLEVSSNDLGNNRIFDYMIKTIVTHEQIEAMEYKVGEENE